MSDQSQNSELKEILLVIESINQRLERIEQASPRSVHLTPSPNHPSLDKLNIAEAIADSIFGSQAKEKACTFEPSKPCDHCSMCNSRGF